LALKCFTIFASLSIAMHKSMHHLGYKNYHLDV
jgi:hypothetical protein